MPVHFRRFQFTVDQDVFYGKLYKFIQCVETCTNGIQFFSQHPGFIFCSNIFRIGHRLFWSPVSLCGTKKFSSYLIPIFLESFNFLYAKAFCMDWRTLRFSAVKIFLQQSPYLTLETTILPIFHFLPFFWRWHESLFRGTFERLWIWSRVQVFSSAQKLASTFEHGQRWYRMHLQLTEPVKRG